MHFVSTAGSATLIFEPHQQCQCFFVGALLEQFSYLVDVAMHQKEVVRGRSATRVALGREIFPERAVLPGAGQIPLNEGHHNAGVAVAIDTIETDVAVRFLAATAIGVLLCIHALLSEKFRAGVKSASQIPVLFVLTRYPVAHR